MLNCKGYITDGTALVFIQRVTVYRNSEYVFAQNTQNEFV